MQKKRKEKIKLAITLFVIIIAFAFVIAVMLKYNIEGEQKMPFNLSEIIVISNAEGKTKTDSAENAEEYQWNLDIIQYNDIYLNIQHNEEYAKNTYIESVSIENISIEKPNKGDVKLYTGIFQSSYDESNEIQRSFTLNGAESSNIKSLEICNQGGNVTFSVANTNLGEYVANKDEEITHNGTILNKINIGLEDIKMNLSFEIVIKTNISTYRGNVELELPCGNIVTEGTCELDKKDCTDIIFKRENY